MPLEIRVVIAKALLQASDAGQMQLGENCLGVFLEEGGGGIFPNFLG